MVRPSRGYSGMPMLTESHGIESVPIAGTRHGCQGSTTQFQYPNDDANKKMKCKLRLEKLLPYNQLALE